jgi:sialate O-acetylesterase
MAANQNIFKTMKNTVSAGRIRPIMILVLSVLSLAGYGQLRMPPVFSSNMIFQQGVKVPVWGKALPNETIQVAFGEQRVTIRTGKDSCWKVELKPMKATFEQRELRVTGQKSSITYHNVVVGEVWICSGQSNMEYPMQLYPGYAQPLKGDNLAAVELGKPENSLIRIYNCSRNGSKTSWSPANGESLKASSAAGYFFARAVQEKLNVPVGIITAAVGGTHIEAWTATEDYRRSSIFAPLLKAGGGEVGEQIPGTWYNAMIAPLIPYAVKGFLWYQGENNCAKRDSMYAEKYKILVEGWREKFNLKAAPFYYVLLAPHIYSDRLHNKNRNAVTAEDLPLFRQQQLKSAAITSNTDYIVVSDLVDDLKDIHPSYKWEVGRRLAGLALAKTYGILNIPCSGPRMKSTHITGDSIVVTFDHFGDGLKTIDQKRLSWFEIAGPDHQFHPALAEIRGKNEVVVFHPDIKNPLRVRLGWHETAMPNLVNGDHLPVTPFSTGL